MENKLGFMMKSLCILFTLIFISDSFGATKLPLEPKSKQDLLELRSMWQKHTSNRLETLEERHKMEYWRIDFDQEPNLKYKDGFEFTKEYYIDNKDRHDLEYSYLKYALEDNFYLTEKFIDFIDRLERLSLDELDQYHHQTRRNQIFNCKAASARLAIHTILDALPLTAGVQAEIYDRLVDRNFHSPESGLAGIAGGVIGSLIERIIHEFYKLQGRQKKEFDGGLWAITRLIWDDSFGVNSKCFIESRKLEAISIIRRQED